MKKNDFIKAFSSYEYFLRSNKNPYIDLYLYAGEPTCNLNYSYFILALPNLFNNIKSHLNTSYEMYQTILLDHTIKNDHHNFFGLFIYDNDKDTVQSWGSKDFQDGEFSVAKMVYNIDDFLIKNGLPKTYQTQIPDYIGQMSYNKEENKLIKKHNCDCGAHKLGHNDDDKFSHSTWCSVNSKIQM